MEYLILLEVSVGLQTTHRYLDHVQEENLETIY